MEAKSRSWWALLSLALVGCSSATEPSKSGEKAAETSDNLQSSSSSALDVTALAEQAAIAADAPCPTCGITVTPNTGLRHILLLSIDGMHAADYYKYVANNPRSNIGMLYLHGIDYPNATTTTPSGGFPGMLAIATGASPKTTGVYDEDSYDRTLYPPGSGCVGATGTEVVYDSSIAQDWTQLFSPINKANLPLFKNAQAQCVEVYPHNFLKTPTIFEVIQGSGRRTAWNDNRASYEILSGPSGKGISELYTPDISSNPSTVSPPFPNSVDLPGSAALCNSDNAYGTPPFSYTSCIPMASAFDDTKVQAVINKIDGFAADGSRQSAVPTILGMSFVAVDVAQKLPIGGYLNNAGDPKPALTAALNRVDLSIGRILTELNTKHFIDNTLVVLTAKHGQSPIDPSKWRTLDAASGSLPVVATDPRFIVQTADTSVDVAKAPFVNPNSLLQPSTAGHVQLADSGIVWLQNQNNVNVTNVVQALTNSTNVASMSATVRPQGSIFSTNIVTGTELVQTYGDPQSSTDLLAAARAPNAFVQPELGVIYKHVYSQYADHGGGAQDDINVPLLISNTGIVNHVSLIQPVSTEQVALTILRALQLDGTKLTGASAEGTSALPGIVWGPGTYQGGSTVTAVNYSSQTNTTVAGTPPYVGNFNAGSSICFNDVYLTDVVSITVTYASANTANNNALSVRIDGPNGTKVGQVTVPATGGWTTWKTISIPIAPAQTGLHQVCLRGEVGTGIANILNFSLVPVCVPECTNATCSSDGCGGVCGTCGFNQLCDDPFAQCIVPPTKYSFIHHPPLDSLIKAPDFNNQVGTQLGTGSTTVTSFDVNDYVCYYGVEFDNVQKIITTLASATGGGTFTFRIDDPNGPIIATYTVPATGGATTFKSKQIPISTTAGVRPLCVRGESGNGIAVLQSFELSDQPVLPKHKVDDPPFSAYPPDSQQGTNNDGAGNVGSFDTNDYVCYEDVDLNGVNSIVAKVASASGGSFSARLGSPSGQKLATFRVPNTGGGTTFVDVASNISTVTGPMTSLCFVGETGNANLKSFTLSSTIIPSKYSLSAPIIPTVPPDFQQGTTNDTTNNAVANFDVNDYFCYDSVDLTGVNSVTVNIASANSGGVFSLRVGSPTGTRVGQNIVLSTGSWTTFTNLNVAISGAPSTPTTLCITGDSGQGIGNIKSITLSASAVPRTYYLGGTTLIPGAPPSSQNGITVNGTTITYFDQNDWFCYDGVDLTGVHNLTVRAASNSNANRFSVRIGSQNGFQIANAPTANTGGYNTYANWNVGISNSPGVQKLCFFGLQQAQGIANIQSVTLAP